MHQRALSQRNDTAHARIIAATERLAEHHELTGQLEAFRTAHDRDREVKAMLQREAIADILTAVADAREAAAEPEGFDAAEQEEAAAAKPSRAREKVKR